MEIFYALWVSFHKLGRAYAIFTLAQGNFTKCNDFKLRHVMQKIRVD